jgi:DNA modification methylase
MSIICGDCLDEMRKMEENSISAIVTDPPYGLSFMGKGWDYEVPGIQYWKECLRITKAGGFLIAMGGTRTFHRLTCAIEDAGFEIRDCVSWLYGSGFPKSHNSFGIEGYGTALKPAWEPCILAMKPLDGTFKQNAEKWGQAGINIEGCRIGNEEIKTCAKLKGHSFTHLGNEEGFNRCVESIHKGRWPANVILDEEAGRMLDEQSGVLKSGGGDKGNKTQDGGYGKKYGYAERIETPSSGGASRFFYCAKASSSERNERLEGLSLSDSETHYGCTSPGRNVPKHGGPRHNNHPTVKPLKLMEYLIKLVMPPKDGILLDPFAGSGTTILAAHRLGMKAIGIEKQPEYAEIATARLKNATIIQEETQMGLFERCTSNL